ncbi:MAG: hypothetical protein RIF41_26260 [Polyangiaceae bacterium]
MTDHPELDEFKRQIEQLRHHKWIASCTTADGMVELRELPLEQIAALLANDAGYHLLVVAADLTRTTLKRALSGPSATLVEDRLRPAYAVQTRLPVRASFDELARSAITQRARDLRRRARAQVEGLFRDRLKAEGVPILMSPPIRRVPGLLIDFRKPDGIFPDPALELPPKLYLEIKNINRVADDIQKRLYELAETSLEMKILYGSLKLRGFNQSTTAAIAGNAGLRAKLRKQIVKSPPAVVAFFICPREEAEKYRAGAEAFIDRLYFQEEVDDCIAFLKSVTDRHS